MLRALQYKLPSSLQAAFKLFSCVTGQWGDNLITGGSNITNQDYFALFAEKEILGSRSQSTANEADALFSITWYQTTSNRRKQVSGSASAWWERSPRYLGSTIFCTVYSNGNAGNFDASNILGLAPFGCL